MTSITTYPFESSVEVDDSGLLWEGMCSGASIYIICFPSKEINTISKLQNM